MMDLQTKLTGGVNKIQQSIEQGKQKLQIVQEINKCRNIIQETAEKRAEELVKLGEFVYKKIRMGEIDDFELIRFSEALVELDKVLYQTKEKMKKFLQSQEEEDLCVHCKQPLSPGARFCGSCGQPVAQDEEDHASYTECPKCEQLVPHPADFCTCCGVKIS